MSSTQRVPPTADFAGTALPNERFSQSRDRRLQERIEFRHRGRVLGGCRTLPDWRNMEKLQFFLLWKRFHGDCNGKPPIDFAENHGFEEKRRIYVDVFHFVSQNTGCSPKSTVENTVDEAGRRGSEPRRSDNAGTEGGDDRVAMGANGRQWAAMGGSGGSGRQWAAMGGSGGNGRQWAAMGGSGQQRSPMDQAVR